MNIKPSIALFIFILIISSCSRPTPSLPTATVQPTSQPTLTQTPEPQPSPTIEHIETGFYTLSEKGWQPVYEGEMTGPVFLPDDFVGGDLDMFQIMQYGYFADYDSENEILSAYIELPPGGYFQIIDLDLNGLENVTCLPEIVSDDTPIEKVKFMPTNGKVNFPSGSASTAWPDILPMLDDTVYLVAVLETAVSADNPNPLAQLAMVCP